MPPAPTKSGTPPNMTSYVVGFTTPHSRLESILEEESKEPINNWEDKHDDGKKRMMVGASTVKTLMKTPMYIQLTSINNWRNLPHALLSSQQEGGLPAKGVNISGKGLH